MAHQSNGIEAQSVGGGGGNGGFAASLGASHMARWLSLGGKGAGGSNGSIVTRQQLRHDRHQGMQSNGIFAQSAGGGGGNGGLAVSAAASDMPRLPWPSAAAAERRHRRRGHR